MSNGWQAARKVVEWVGLILLSISIWVMAEVLYGYDVRLDRHYHARAALEGEVGVLQDEVGVLQDEVGVLRDLVRQGDKYIDCYYETAHRQYKRMEALSTCLELK